MVFFQGDYKLCSTTARVLFTPQSHTVELSKGFQAKRLNVKKCDGSIIV